MISDFFEFSGTWDFSKILTRIPESPKNSDTIPWTALLLTRHDQQKILITMVGIIGAACVTEYVRSELVCGVCGTLAGAR